MQKTQKYLLVVYLLLLLWLILFKTSLDFAGVLSNYQARSLNLIPFAGFSRANAREMIDNCIVFVPLGVLLGINLKRIELWRKLVFIFLFSLSAEMFQFVLAIGTSDITDVIMNTLGGLFGLALYGLGHKYIDVKKLDGFLAIVITTLLIACILLRFLVFKVKY